DHVAGHDAGGSGIDPEGELGRVRGTAELVEGVSEAAHLGVDHLERLAVKSRLVGDFRQRRGDVVDRDQVDATPFHADQRDPGRQGVTQSLDDLERVIDAVDPVGLTSFRGPDHDPGRVDPDGYPGLLADGFGGVVVRYVVGVYEP